MALRLIFYFHVNLYRQKKIFILFICNTAQKSGNKDTVLKYLNDESINDISESICNSFMVYNWLVKYVDGINQIRNIEVIAWTTLIFGVLLYFSDKSKNEKKLDSVI